MITPVPVVVQTLVSCPTPHLPNTGSQNVGYRPRGLNLIATCPSCPIDKRKGVVGLAFGAMAIDMPGRHGRCDLGPCSVELDRVGKLLHASVKVSDPLACDIVCDDDLKKCDAHKRRKDDVVHICVPVCATLLVYVTFSNHNLYVLLPLLQIARSIRTDKTMSRADDQPRACDIIPRRLANGRLHNGVVLRVTSVDLNTVKV